MKTKPIDAEGARKKSAKAKGAQAKAGSGKSKSAVGNDPDALIERAHALIAAAANRGEDSTCIDVWVESEECVLALMKKLSDFELSRPHPDVVVISWEEERK